MDSASCFLENGDFQFPTLTFLYNQPSETNPFFSRRSFALIDKQTVILQGRLLVWGKGAVGAIGAEGGIAQGTVLRDL